MANCTGNTSGSTMSIPAQTVSGTMAHIQMLLLLPDGRSVGVYCNDHIILLGPRVRACKNPEVDEMEADFSGEKVKLTWGVGIDGKKKESETFMVGPVFPATPAPSKP